MSNNKRGEKQTFIKRECAFSYYKNFDNDVTQHSELCTYLPLPSHKSQSGHFTCGSGGF